MPNISTCNTPVKVSSKWKTVLHFTFFRTKGWYCEIFSHWHEVLLFSRITERKSHEVYWQWNKSLKLLTLLFNPEEGRRHELPLAELWFNWAIEAVCFLTLRKLDIYQLTARLEATKWTNVHLRPGGLWKDFAKFSTTVTQLENRYLSR